MKRTLMVIGVICSLLSGLYSYAQLGGGDPGSGDETHAGKIYHINIPTDVGGLGHSALIVLNASGYTYYSYGPSGLTVSNYSNAADALAAAGTAGYTRFDAWWCSGSEAKAARQAAAAYDGTSYNVTTHNCWNMFFRR